MKRIATRLPKMLGYGEVAPHTFLRIMLKHRLIREVNTPMAHVKLRTEDYCKRAIGAHNFSFAA